MNNISICPFKTTASACMQRKFPEYNMISCQKEIDNECQQKQNQDLFIDKVIAERQRSKRK